MHDEAAFLAAIIDRPDDDLPRLVYADWLEDRGQGDRAEFIRVQCELALIGYLHPPADDEDRAVIARHNALRRRERELLRGAETDPAKWGENTLRWFGDFIRLNALIEGPVFRRGFAEEVSMAWNPDAIKAIRERTPLKRVRLTVAPELEPIRAYGQFQGWTVGPLPFPVNELRVLNPTREDVRAYLEQEVFPGLEFELPPAPTFPQATDAARRRWRGFFTNAELERMHREHNEAAVLNFIRVERGVQDQRRWRRIETDLAGRDTPFLECICECQTERVDARMSPAWETAVARVLRRIILQRNHIMFGGFSWQVFVGPCPDCGLILHTRPTPVPNHRPTVV